MSRRAMTAYSHTTLNGVRPTPGTKVAGRCAGKKVMPVKTAAATASAAARRVRFVSQRSGRRGCTNALAKSAEESRSRAAIQYWLDLLVELAVTKAGIA